jgi:hypothetical protein
MNAAIQLSPFPRYSFAKSLDAQWLSLVKSTPLIMFAITIMSHKIAPSRIALNTRLDPFFQL